MSVFMELDKIKQKVKPILFNLEHIESETTKDEIILDYVKDLIHDLKDRIEELGVYFETGCE